MATGFSNVVLTLDTLSFACLSVIFGSSAALTVSYLAKAGISEVVTSFDEAIDLSMFASIGLASIVPAVVFSSLTSPSLFCICFFSPTALVDSYGGVI